MSKRGLFARVYAPNQTLIRVKTRLPKGNPNAGNGGPPSPWELPKSPDFGAETASRPLAVSQAGGSCRQEVGGVRPEGEALSPAGAGRSAAWGGRDAAS